MDWIGTCGGDVACWLTDRPVGKGFRNDHQKSGSKKLLRLFDEAREAASARATKIRGLMKAGAKMTYGINWPEESMQPMDTGNWIPVYIVNEETRERLYHGKVSPELFYDLQAAIENGYPARVVSVGFTDDDLARVAAIRDGKIINLPEKPGGEKDRDG